MKDIKIINDRFEFKNGDLVLIDGKERILQHLKTGLKIIVGTWQLDYRQGIDYIGGLRAFRNIMKAQIKRAISTVYGIEQVLRYDMKEENDIFYIKAYVFSQNEEILLQEEYRA